MCGKELVLDTLPLLVTVVQPPIKTVREGYFSGGEIMSRLLQMNTSLLTSHEEKIINTVVSVLRSFGLTFTAVTVEGNVQYTFSP